MRYFGKLQNELSENDKTERRGFLSKFAIALAGFTLLPHTIKAAEKDPDGGKSTMGTDPFIGEIALCAFNFAPNGWAICNGALLQITQNTALFSLLGTQFGGDGIHTFGLPDLRGRVPIGFGQGTGLTNRNMGDKSGEENHVLLSTEMPQHAHSLLINTGVGTSDTPSGNYLARNSEGVKQFSSSTNATSTNFIGAVGNNAAHNNMQPFLTLNFIISLSGVFPSRS
jgi:microcystin-dependent protein